MNTFRIIISGANDLRRHGLRSFLASLGVILGSGAVISMLSITQGAKKVSLNAIYEQGVDNIFITSEKPKSIAQKEKDSGDKNNLQKYGATAKDIKHIRENYANVNNAFPVRKFDFPIYKNGQKTSISVVAVPDDFFRLTRFKVWGRLFSPMDSYRENFVAVVGSKASRKIFDFHNPLGKFVTVNDVKFKVVGTIKAIAQNKLPDGSLIENQIFIPFSTALGLWGNSKFFNLYANFVYVKVGSTSAIKETSKRIRRYLSLVHQKDDWSIAVPYVLLEQTRQSKRTFTIVMASIACIALLVGGIGIMNIMLANILERTKEIGTLRALGANHRDIVFRFLSQATMLSFAGGCLGVSLGIFCAFLIEKLSSLPTHITLFSVLLSLGFSFGFGIIFGTYPAIQASKLSPVEALKRE